MKDEDLIVRPIVVIADDLTGAAEIAGIASAYGLNVDLLTVMPDGMLTVEKEVTVLATDTRSTEEPEAMEVSRRVGRVLPTDAVLFKKTDSALRGHIMAETRSLIEERKWRQVIFIPANPSRGRTISGGTYFVNDVPISETPFAEDPEFPAKTSLLHERFPEAEKLGILMPDISSEEDVRRWVSQADAQTLLVGAADLFSALLLHFGAVQQPEEHNFRFPTEEVLVVCGSTQSQPDKLPFSTAYMPLALYNGVEDHERWVEEVAPLYAAHHALALGIAHRHLTGKNVAVRLRETTAAVVKALVVMHRPKELVIEGGATAFACCRVLGLSHFSDICQLAPGVVRMRADNGMYLTLKPGSYEWNDD